MNFSGTVDCLNCKTQMTGSGGQFSPDLANTFRSCECGMNAVFYRADKSLEVSLSARKKDFEENVANTKKELLAVFTLAGLKALQVFETENGYYSRGGAPWLLVKTQFGMIHIGWRKRVISINWLDTGVEYTVADDVTKEVSMCHAWSYAKAVEYLTGFRREAEKSYCVFRNKQFGDLTKWMESQDSMIDRDKTLSKINEIIRSEMH